MTSNLWIFDQCLGKRGVSRESMKKDRSGIDSFCAAILRYSLSLYHARNFVGQFVRITDPLLVRQIKDEN